MQDMSNCSEACFCGIARTYSTSCLMDQALFLNPLTKQALLIESRLTASALALYFDWPA
jgi:hypothetical protein